METDLTAKTPGTPGFYPQTSTDFYALRLFHHNACRICRRTLFHSGF
jgi:hypothetical protein